MVLIIGGAYQGKLSYAKTTYGIDTEEIFTCTAELSPDMSFRCIRHLEDYVLYCVRNGCEPDLKPRDDAILICRDISAGIVPVDAETRAWREAVGRYLNRLAVQCSSVIRLFCGLPQILK